MDVAGRSGVTQLRSLGTSPFVRNAGGWALAAVLAAYILFATRDWDVPRPGDPSFGPLWIGATLALLAAWRVSGRALSPLAVIALGAIAAMALTDLAYSASRSLRDLHLYLGAGERFAAGQPVYLAGLLTERPVDLTTYPYLYPPPTLPLFAALAGLRGPVLDALWLAGSVAAALATLRLFGLSWRWAFLLLLWPPVFQGIQVGNVAVFTALLFAAAPWIGAGLVVAGVFKIYSGVAALWLVRERRWRALAVGVAIVLAWCLATLPLTGLDRWTEWWRGLEWYRASQASLPDSLYGFGLGHDLPALAALAVGVLAVVLALQARGATALGRLGLATAVAAPSLFAHGLMVALPAFLELRAVALWTTLAITSVAPGMAWWIAIGLAIAAWFVPSLRRPPGDDAWHPAACGGPTTTRSGLTASPPASTLTNVR